jgi:hypothetical protein
MIARASEPEGSPGFVHALDHHICLLTIHLIDLFSHQPPWLVIVLELVVILGCRRLRSRPPRALPVDRLRMRSK